MSISLDLLDKLKEEFIEQNHEYLDKYKENVLHRFVMYINKNWFRTSEKTQEERNQ